MRKIFYFLVIVVQLIGLISCNTTIEVNVHYGDENLIIYLDKDKPLSNDLLSNNKFDLNDLYYDEDYSYKYEGELISKNINLFVKESINFKININGEIINIELIKNRPLDNTVLNQYNINVNDLYYDEDYIDKYNGELISEDIILYYCEKIGVKIIDGESSKDISIITGECLTNEFLEQFNIDISYLYKDSEFKYKYLEEPITENTSLYVMKKLTWTNENAVYCQYKFNSINEVTESLDSVFETLDYKKLFVVEKSEYSTLLFILNDTKQDEFIENLKLIENVSNIYKSIDVPFEKVDTRYLEADSNKIKIGEKIRITQKGYIKEYLQRYDYDSLKVELINQDEKYTYTASDFKGIRINKVNREWSGELNLEIKANDIFELIYYADLIARNNRINLVKLSENRYELGMYDPDHKYWTYSTENILEFGEGFISGYMEAMDEDGYWYCDFLGLNSGQLTVKYTDDYGTLEIIVEVLE